MGETLKRIVRLPKTIKNPFQRPSAEQRATGILSSLVALPEFQNDIEGLSDMIKVVTTPPVATTQSQDLGHPTKALDKTLELLESRVRLGQVQEGAAKKYLDALRFQRELSLQRPPSLASRIGSSIINNPIRGGISFAALTSIPMGLARPYDSVEDFIFRAGFSAVVASVIIATTKKW